MKKEKNIYSETFYSELLFHHSNNEKSTLHLGGIKCTHQYMFLLLTICFSNFVLMIQIVILRVYYTIPFAFTLFWHFWANIFNFLNYLLWLRITDDGSVPEMRIWSISLIKSDLKWCIHLSRSLFFNL